MRSKQSCHRLFSYERSPVHVHRAHNGYRSFTTRRELDRRIIFRYRLLDIVVWQGDRAAAAGEFVCVEDESHWSVGLHARRR